MKKTLAAILLLVSFINSPALADSVVATYVGGDVKEDQLMALFRPALAAENKGKKFAELPKEMQELMIKGYVTAKMMEKKADESKLRDTQSYKDKLEAAKMQILQQEFIESKLKGKVTDKMVSDEYKKLVEDAKGKKEIEVSHILFDDEKQAKEVKQELDKISDQKAKLAKFAELAKKYSKDEGSKNSGGKIGFVQKGQLVPEFENKAFSMKSGDISDPVKTQFGVHIILVGKIQPVTIPPQNEAEPIIRQNLSRAVIEQISTELLAEAKLQMKTEANPQGK